MEYIVNHSDAKFFFTDTAIFDNFNIDGMTQLETVVSLDDYSLLYTQLDNVKSFFENEETCFKKIITADFNEDDIDWHNDELEELAIINYTSNTTSNPKGVMIPYRSVWSNNKFANDNLPSVVQGGDVVCMLLMAHTYGLAFEIIRSITAGCHIHFLGRLPSPRIIEEEFAKYRPKLIFSVPLIIEKIVQGHVFQVIEKGHVKHYLKFRF